MYTRECCSCVVVKMITLNGKQVDDAYELVESQADILYHSMGYHQDTHITCSCGLHEKWSCPENAIGTVETHHNMGHKVDVVIGDVRSW